MMAIIISLKCLCQLISRFIRIFARAEEGNWWAANVQTIKRNSRLLLAWRRHQMETFSELLAFWGGIHRSPVNSPHKGQWRGALVFSLMCTWTYNGWANHRDAGDLRHHRTQYDVIVMVQLKCDMPWWRIYESVTRSSVVQVWACRLFGAESLPKPMLTSCQLDANEQTLEFESKHKSLLYQNVVWKRCPAFCSGPLLLTWINFNPLMDK